MFNIVLNTIFVILISMAISLGVIMYAYDYANHHYSIPKDYNSTEIAIKWK